MSCALISLVWHIWKNQWELALTTRHRNGCFSRERLVLNEVERLDVDSCHLDVGVAQVMWFCDRRRFWGWMCVFSWLQTCHHGTLILRILFSYPASRLSLSTQAASSPCPYVRWPRHAPSLAAVNVCSLAMVCVSRSSQGSRRAQLFRNNCPDYCVPKLSPLWYSKYYSEKGYARLGMLSRNDCRLVYFIWKVAHLPPKTVIMACLSFRRGNEAVVS